MLRLGGTLLLTRLFSPELFGILAVTAAAQVAIGLLTDIGLRQAIIQSPNGRQTSFLNTAWTVQILRGCAIWCTGVCLAIGLMVITNFGWLDDSSIYANPVLQPLIVATSFSAIILGFQSTKIITAGRDLKLARPTLIELLSSLCTLVVTGIAGWLTHSIWSFVAGAWLSSALTVILSQTWLPGPSNRLAWQPDALKEMAHFGKWIFFSSAISSLAMSGDRFLLASWLSAVDLGCYSIASNISSVPDTIAYRLFTNVAMPALSDVVRNQPHRLPVLYNRLRLLSDSALVFLAGLIFACGEWIVNLLYDPRYAAAGPMLQYLSFALLFTRYGVAQSLFLSLGNSRIVALLNVVKVVSLFLSVPVLFYLLGPHGAILGVALHMAPTVLGVLWFSHRFGVSNVFLEIGMLLLWPLGWVFGLLMIDIGKFVGL